MARRKIRWKIGSLVILLLFNVFTKSLPIERSSNLVQTTATDTNFENPVHLNSLVNTSENDDKVAEENTKEDKKVSNSTAPKEMAALNKVSHISRNLNRNNILRELRPGQDVREYDVEITFNEGEFQGKVVVDIRIPDADIREDAILFYVEDLNIQSVTEGSQNFDFGVDDGILEIFPDRPSASYLLTIEYSGVIRDDGTGIFQDSFNDQTYLGMNLFPTHARRVFPCVDELSHFARVSFTFNDVPHNNIIVNSEGDSDNQNTFQTIQGPMHLWGMIAHDFPTVVIPVTNVILYGRPGLGQDGQAAIALQSFFNALNEWTLRPYFEILDNQDGRLAMVAVPDTDVDWYALSTIAVWEPYIYMEITHSMKQRNIGLVKIAEAMARQWFGYVLYPNNWKSQWIISGLATYAAYDIVGELQTNPGEAEQTMLDMNTLFVTDIIQESLLRDAYSTAPLLIPEDDLEGEEHIRDHINGLLRYKAPSILKMLRNILGDDDYIQRAAQALLSRRTLEPISFDDFYDSLESVWDEDIKLIGDIDEYVEQWTTNRGYPFIHVGLRQGGLSITQEHFGFTGSASQNFIIPITYTTSIQMDFSNVRPIEMKENTLALPMFLDEDDFVLFNIQGQGYYRVDYDNDLWERIIEALNDPDRRAQIHPLNRATLIDDSLNLARAGKLDYDIAFQVVLAMEHETEYAPWKAFVRNMNFLKKRLLALVTDDDDLDQDIYLRMIRRTMGAFEDEIGFTPEFNANEPAMVALTRGLVMDHACRANYAPCITAAADWFYDNDVVNPNIPRDIRPAVYCTMVREEGEDAIQALKDRLEIEPSHYERVVILESFGCSQDEDFINELLAETIADDSPYGMEEKSRIFTAVAESSFQNVRLAIDFMQRNTAQIRNSYGGARKLEELIFVIVENAVDNDLVFELTCWINSRHSDLDDSTDLADRARAQLEEDIFWEQNRLEEVYEWIDDNGASETALSLSLLIITILITLFNNEN